MSSEVETVAQEQVQVIATVELEAIRLRLRSVHDSLPVSPKEALMLLGEAEIDISTEVRSTIECVLNDHIEPAIRTLMEVASFRPASEAEA